MWQDAADAILLSLDSYLRKQDWEVLAYLGISDLVGLPHSIRHTGPSYDVLVAYRDLREVQRRGRWRSDSSVLRYSRSHAYTKVLAQAPEDLRLAGEALISSLGVRRETAAN